MSNCPKCLSTDSEVKDSRPRKLGDTITTRRRRLCVVCDNKYTTYEVGTEFLRHLQELESGGYLNAFAKLKRIKRIIDEG